MGVAFSHLPGFGYPERWKITLRKKKERKKLPLVPSEIAIRCSHTRGSLWGFFPCPLAPALEIQKCFTAGLAGTVWIEEISSVLLISPPTARAASPASQGAGGHPISMGVTPNPLQSILGLNRTDSQWGPGNWCKVLACSVYDTKPSCVAVISIFYIYTTIGSPGFSCFPEQWKMRNNWRHSKHWNIKHPLDGQWPSADIFLVRAARAVLDWGVRGAVDGEPERETFEIAEKHDFPSQRSGERESWVYNTNTLAFMPLSNQSLSKKAC